MNVGDRVELLAYGDELIVRRVVSMTSRSVQVCTEDAWAEEMRGPKRRTIGFPLRDVVRVLPVEEVRAVGDTGGGADA